MQAPEEAGSENVQASTQTDYEDIADAQIARLAALDALAVEAIRDLETRMNDEPVVEEPLEVLPSEELPGEETPTLEDIEAWLQLCRDELRIRRDELRRRARIEDVRAESNRYRDALGIYKAVRSSFNDVKMDKSASRRSVLIDAMTSLDFATDTPLGLQSLDRDMAAIDRAAKSLAGNWRDVTEMVVRAKNGRWRNSSSSSSHHRYHHHHHHFYGGGPQQQPTYYIPTPSPYYYTAAPILAPGFSSYHHPSSSFMMPSPTFSSVSSSFGGASRTSFFAAS